jgi:DNA-binding MarR family transcriptional regulator
MNDISYGKYISVLYRHLQIIINHDLKEYNLGSGQYLFLIEVHIHEGINQRDLTSLMKIDKATTAKALIKLENLGYIDREKDVQDRRYYKIFLTDKGKKFMPILKDKLDNLSSTLIQGMTEEEKSTTSRLLDIMIKNAVNEVTLLK